MFTYDDALKYIHDLNKFGTKLGLQNIIKLLELLGDPQKGMKIIHVAGTNGKGSTCSMIYSVLKTAGYKVGLYTSPYLEVFNERMRINDEIISNDDLVKYTLEVQEVAEYMRANGLGSPTEFEVVTAIAFLYFREHGVDYLVLEVGMGGRLDATNVVEPLVGVITPISLDHQEYLGDDLVDIAREKCGIIKPGMSVVTAPQEPAVMKVIEETCQAKACKLVKVAQGEDSGLDGYYQVRQDDEESRSFDLTSRARTYDNLSIGFLGSHQMENAATAVMTLETLSFLGVHIEVADIYQGLKLARWPGRLELIGERPLVLIDGAHNVAGAKALKAALERYFPKRKKILVLGILGDKDYDEILNKLIPMADVIVSTAPENPRALKARKLSEAIRSLYPELVLNHHGLAPLDEKGKITIYTEEQIKDAVRRAYSLAQPQDMIVFAGSLYLIGNVKMIIRGQ